MKRHRKHWTFSGIKQYYPSLSFKTWLAACQRGLQYELCLPTLSEAKTLFSK